jgi:hypothetical protein
VHFYDLVFKMCIQAEPNNHSAALYARYTSSLETYLKGVAAPLLTTQTRMGGMPFLQEWARRWKKYKLVIQGMSKLFMYLDRFYTSSENESAFALKEQAYRLFQTHIYEPHRAQARQFVLEQVDRERDNEAINRHMLKNAVDVFDELGRLIRDGAMGAYVDDLEKELVARAGAFYSLRARAWLQTDSCPTYMAKVEKVMRDEASRVEAFLNRHTLEPLQRECYTQLLCGDTQKTLLEMRTGVAHMLRTNATEDLSRINRIYNDEDLGPVACIVREYISDCGLAIVNEWCTTANAERETEKAASTATATATTAAAATTAATTDKPQSSLVQSLVDLHAQYKALVRTCFAGKPAFQRALKEAFEGFINRDNRVSKMLARYANDVLKKGSKVNVQSVEQTLEDVVALYGYVQEKDVFERDYQLHLAKRLLLNVCESQHSEKSMIAKLKSECGYQWTNKLEGMFKDVVMSKETMKDFARFFDAPSECGIALDVTVCNTGYWPATATAVAQQASPCAIPSELQLCCDKYVQFYTNKHSGHKLRWRMDQGKAEVQVRFSAGVTRGLLCSTYQMLIILVFNSVPRVTSKQIQEITGISRKELANHLLSLAHPKVGVLLKRPNNNRLADDHQFMLNGKFTSNVKLVVVPVLVLERNVTEEADEAKAINLQRIHQTDAAIVRIMKTRKTLRHTQLVAEAMQQLQARFKPQPSMIKKRIESLIESEYLERNEDDRALYNYMA